MNLNIARWGNSLALCIPADHARRALLMSYVDTGVLVAF